MVIQQALLLQNETSAMTMMWKTITLLTKRLGSRLLGKFQNVPKKNLISPS